MNTLSIIIPVLDEQECVVDRLTHLQSLRDENCEIILVDGGSSDATVALATPLVDKLVKCGSGRALQMNAGAELAQGKLLLFLHIDTTLPANAKVLIDEAIGDSQLKWGRFNLKFDKSSLAFKIISSNMNKRATLTRVCTGDQSLFVTKALFEQVQGFPALPLMEDVALSKSLRRIRKPIVIDSFVVTSSRRWERHGVVRTVVFMWWLRLLFFLGVSPASLAKLYYPSQSGDAGEKEAGINAELRFRHPGSRILLYAKAPVLGEVKTRLEPVLGEEKSLLLHQAMTSRVATLLNSSRLAPWQLWVSADVSNEFFLTLCNKKNICLQEGEDLGEKMARSAALTLEQQGVNSIIILGSDCPGYDASYLENALEKLAEGSEVVLGPAVDGGYVLIGLRAVYPALFTGIDWGSSRVFEQTVARIEALNLSYSVLETLWDVDRPEDLPRLEALNPPLGWDEA
ncbi:MAG: DUF2064 domain-containing protein [Pseudomonadales bacterium]|nr:DUF2064 domain-containing protein [Pseudomonadales bacterium]